MSPQIYPFVEIQYFEKLFCAIIQMGPLLSGTSGASRGEA